MVLEYAVQPPNLTLRQKCSHPKQIGDHCAPISEQFAPKMLANGPVLVFRTP